MNNGDVSNSLFTQTLFTDEAVRAFLSMYRPGRGRAKNIADAEAAGDALLGDKDQGEVESRREDERTKLDSQADLDEPEGLILVSLGKGVDGGIKRLHGGVTATLLDQVMGILISYSHQNTSATAELTIKYKKPIETPCVLLCRARIVREAGRWIETVGWVEDGHGTIFAEGKGAFVKSRVTGQPDKPKSKI
jgi:acyl-coenzyme A thioesterase PaaI-like protein